MRDRFLNNSDYLDKQHLERSALTASQLKRRIDQSRENLKIVRKGQLSRDTSPLQKQQLTSDRDKERAKALKELLEANARWNNERRDAAKNDIRKLVDETGLLNPDLRKEMIYSWEKGFVEDKVENQCKSLPKTILQKDPLRKSGQVLTRPLKGKIASETDSTIKTSVGSIYRKSEIAQSKTVLTQKNQRSTSKSSSLEPTKSLRESVLQIYSRSWDQKTNFKEKCKIPYFEKFVKTTATAHAAGTGGTIRLRGAYRKSKRKNNLPFSSYRSILKISISESYEIHKWKVHSTILEIIYRHTWCP